MRVVTASLKAETRLGDQLVGSRVRGPASRVSNGKTGHGSAIILPYSAVHGGRQRPAVQPHVYKDPLVGPGKLGERYAPQCAQPCQTSCKCFIFLERGAPLGGLEPLFSP